MKRRCDLLSLQSSIQPLLRLMNHSLAWRMRLRELGRACMRSALDRYAWITRKRCEKNVTSSTEEIFILQSAYCVNWWEICKIFKFNLPSACTTCANSTYRLSMHILPRWLLNFFSDEHLCKAVSFFLIVCLSWTWSQDGFPFRMQKGSDFRGIIWFKYKITGDARSLAHTSLMTAGRQQWSAANQEPHQKQWSSFCGKGVWVQHWQPALPRSALLWDRSVIGIKL